jgi:hypothetical protein
MRSPIFTPRAIGFLILVCAHYLQSAIAAHREGLTPAFLGGEFVDYTQSYCAAIVNEGIKNFVFNEHLYL